MSPLCPTRRKLLILKISISRMCSFLCLGHTLLSLLSEMAKNSCSTAEKLHCFCIVTDVLLLLLCVAGGFHDCSFGDGRMHDTLLEFLCFVCVKPDLRPEIVPQQQCKAKYGVEVADCAGTLSVGNSCHFTTASPLASFFLIPPLSTSACHRFSLESTYEPFW